MIRDALVVGINTYQDDNLRDLNAPAIDAEAIAQILEKYGKFNVWRLPEAIDPDTKKPYIAKSNELSLIELQEAIEKLFNPQDKRVPDTALFYFSGHGVRQNKAVQEGYLGASNVRPQIGFNGLSLQWLRRLLQKSPIKQQIVWLDCCHSGELLNFDEAYPGTEGLARDQFFIASSRAFEKSLEDLETSYSVLTKYLLSGLDPNRCPKKWITSDNLTVFINENLQNENQRPVILNFGESIELTCTWEVSSFLSKGEESEDICPYKGLAYFDCNDLDPQYFYGREKLTDELLNRVRQNNFLAILGASGSGKSSVLRAGLLHHLKLGRKLPVSKNWKIKIILPGEHPLQNLALSWLEPGLSNVERATQLQKTKSLLEQGSEGLVTLVQAYTANRVILALDQFEEVFTLCQDVTEREAFFQCLLEALEKTNNKLCLILAMRIDFLGKCFEREYSDLGNKIQNKDSFITIPTMKQEELKQAIIKPADLKGVRFEAGLIRRILNDVEYEAGNLPLLEFALTELWKRRNYKQLTNKAYDAIGQVQGAVTRHADENYCKFNETEQKRVQQIFIQLIRPGEGTEDTRRLATKKELSEIASWQLVKKLADARLVVTSRNNANQETVGVIHEALIRKWGKLQQWMNECRSFRLWQEELRLFMNSGKKDTQQKEDGFLRGTKLEVAEKYAQTYRLYLSPDEQKFIQDSIEHRKRKRKQMFLGLAAVIFLVVLGVFSGIALQPIIIQNQIIELKNLVKKIKVIKRGIEEREKARKNIWIKEQEIKRFRGMAGRYPDRLYKNNLIKLQAELDYIRSSLPRITLRDVDSAMQEVDCTILKALLTIKNWKEANQETANIIRQFVGKENKELLRREDINNFSCQYLRMIDQLWIKYSQGKFGFSVQQDIYQKLNGTIKERERSFGEQVGWIENGQWLKDYTFNLDAPKGHLPVFDNIVHQDLFIDDFFSRRTNCTYKK